VRALASTWSLCVWSIADSDDEVSPEFRNHIVEQYLVFMLKLGWQSSEIYFGSAGNNVQGLDIWRDLFLRELQNRFMPTNSPERRVLKEAAELLDKGKGYVIEGYGWLEEQLFGNPGIANPKNKSPASGKANRS
jgi:hypothetical protein